MVSSTDGWAVGNLNVTRYTVLRWNGANWTALAPPQIPADSGDNKNLNSVFMLDINNDGIADRGWAVGVEYKGSCTGPNRLHTILQWDGATSRWSRLSPLDIPACSRDNKTLNSIYMLSSTEGWAVGDRIANTDNGWTFLKWDGTNWSRFAVTTSGTRAQDLNSVYMLSSTEGWAVGNGGVILRWDGSQWSAVTSPVASQLNSVYIIDISQPLGPFWQERF